jgi:hypothetical protein
MTSASPIITLQELPYLPYIDASGYLPPELRGKIGVYAIFDLEKVLQFVGYSRDVYVSLENHLIRQPQSCYWLKLHLISRPSRSILEDLRQAWIEENGFTPSGNADREKDWTEAIDVKPSMTEQDRAIYSTLTETEQIKFLKNLSRQAEDQLLKALKTRGVVMEIRFNPKLKEQGLLDLKP